MLTSTPKENDENGQTSTRKNLRSLKNPIKETPRRKSLGANHKVKELKETKEKSGTIGKLVKRMRKSLVPGDLAGLVALRHAENELEKADNAMEVDQVSDKKAAENKSGKAMRFDHRHESLNGYWKVNLNIDLELTAIGGLIMLHQYCYKEFQTTGLPVFRDGANFFRSVDLFCITNLYHIPIRMVYLKMISCKTVEEWCRDYYSARETRRKDVVNDYNEDKYTVYDELFDGIGRDSDEMICMEMQKMEHYCSNKFKMTKIDEYEKGTTFWMTVAPSHLPRNYQLALLLCKKQNWNIEVVEKWFRMLYTNKCWAGGRSKDVYSDRLV
ncbi:hypothetical protein CAEBREN_17160 [Caenorhabditis brenneri]|uniref:Uncharacterized protein n=1 Tax=Caenorhabditis brenneri TaxID=135651 RepID=G0MSS3_CAEBE|nr:hypothetical protein CAEBREN_17160 [Caenorhabditis brenneri]